MNSNNSVVHNSGLYETIKLLTSIDNNIMSSDSTQIIDADEDTYVRTEETLAENKIRFATNGTERMIITDDGFIGIGTDTPDVSMVIDTTDALRIPVGTTSQRPTGTQGDLRYNTTNDLYEGFFSDINTWASLGGQVKELNFDDYTLNQTGDDILLIMDGNKTDSIFNLKMAGTDGDSTFIATSRSADSDISVQKGYIHRNISSDSELETDLFTMKATRKDSLNSEVSFSYRTDGQEFNFLHVEESEISIGDERNFVNNTRESFQNPKKALAVHSTSEIGIRIVTDDATKSDIGFQMNAGDVAESQLLDESINNGMRLGAINVDEFHIDTNKQVRFRIGLDGNVRIGDADTFPTRGDINNIFEIVVPDNEVMLGITATSGSTDVTTISSNVIALDYAVIIDTKTTGTNGGTFTSGVWQTRTLNSITQTNGFATLASNQITIQPGTYIATFFAPAYAVNSHQARLQDVTNTVTLITGTNAYSNSVQGTGTNSGGTGIFTLSTVSLVELQHQCQTTNTTDGYGLANSFGGAENYGSVSIQLTGTSFDQKIKISVNEEDRWIYTSA